MPFRDKVAARGGRFITGGFSVKRAALRLAFLIAFAVTLAGPCAAAPYERAPSFTARQVLPPSLLNSPYYKVQNQVGMENYQYVFTVDTQWPKIEVEAAEQSSSW